METVREYPKPKVEHGKELCPLCNAQLDVTTDYNYEDGGGYDKYYECEYCDYYWVP